MKNNEYIPLFDFDIDYENRQLKAGFEAFYASIIFIAFITYPIWTLVLLRHLGWI